MATCKRASPCLCESCTALCSLHHLFQCSLKPCSTVSPVVTKLRTGTVTHVIACLLTGAWCGHEPRGAPPWRRQPPAYWACIHCAAGCSARAEGGTYCCAAHWAPQGHSQDCRQRRQVGIVQWLQLLAWHTMVHQCWQSPSSVLRVEV